MTVAFTVTDNEGNTSAAANEVITVNNVQEGPTATPSTSSGNEDTNIDVALAGTDSDGGGVKDGVEDKNGNGIVDPG